MSDFEDAKLILTPNAYKAGKAYCVKPFDGSGDLTVVRNTTATARNSSGNLESVAANVPRLNYPVGGGCPSWLIEPQRTNTVTFSNDFTNAAWNLTTEVNLTPNSAISPDGIINATKVVPTTNNVTHYIGRSIQSITGGVYSVFVKADGYDWILLTSHTTSAPEVRGHFFNISNGTVGSTAGTAQTAWIEDWGDGWYRCSIDEGNSPSSLFTVIVSNADGVVSFAGNGIDGVLVYEAQNEQGSYPTSQIPTTGTTVTRNADVFSKTGISSLIGQTEGSIFIDVNLNSTIGGGVKLISVVRPSSGQFITMYLNNSGILAADFYPSGAYTFSLGSGIAITQGRHKIAIAYKQGDYAMYVDGVLLSTNTNPAPLSTTKSYLDISSKFDGTTNTYCLYVNRLTNAELEKLTTL